MTALAQPLLHESDGSYRSPSRMSEIEMERRIYRFPVTESPSTEGASTGETFSPAVHRRFWWAALLILISGSVSLGGVVAENDVASLIGAALLAMGLFAVMGWAAKAHDERKAHLGR